MSVMGENDFTPPIQSDPELRQTTDQPQGVLKKNLKTFVYLGAASLVIVAALFSSNGKKMPTQQGAKGQPPQPMLQDNTDNNVRDLKNQVQAERQKDQQAAQAAAAQDPTLTAASGLTPAQQAAAAPYEPTGIAVPCAPGQPCQQVPAGYGQPNVQPQLTPEQQQVQQLAAKERERADESRFASNLVYARSPDQPHQQQQVQGPQQTLAQAPLTSPRPADTSLVPPHAAGDPPETAGGYKRPVEANIDSATGQPYLVYEGTVLDTILMNRLDGDAAGPVKVLVSEPLYSHDRQHVLIPDGTIALGEAKKIGAAGLGQQRRMALVFHRIIMPDGYSVDLDQFHGLDQIGEEGAKDKVNNHYLQIFGTSIALGLVAGAGEIEEGGGTISTNGSQAFSTGAAASVSQSATTILDRFMQIPPTITIREGNRIKIYFTQDMLLPAYTNHTIPQTF
jgi:type IV secretory pathway VirB10-like protein